MGAFLKCEFSKNSFRIWAAQPGKAPAHSVVTQCTGVLGVLVVLVTVVTFALSGFAGRPIRASVRFSANLKVCDFAPPEYMRTL